MSSVELGGTGGIQPPYGRASVTKILNEGNRSELTRMVKEISWEEIQKVDRSQLTAKGTKMFAGVIFSKLRVQTREMLQSEDLCSSMDEVVERFNDIHCIKKTAIELEGFSVPYLHANYVKFKKNDFPDDVQEQMEEDILSSFIAAQAPIAKGDIESLRKQETEEMFWKAALDQSNVIIDLTRPSDSVEAYFPRNVHVPGGDIGQRKIGNITVTCRKKDEIEFGIEVHQYHVEDHKTGKEKDITRIHYSSWEDHAGVKEENFSELEFLKAFEDHVSSQYPEKLPTMVHCRAGVGRTGTYCVFSVMKELNKQNLLNKENQIEIVRKLTLAGRKQRGHQFVQKIGQLETLLEISEKMINQESEEHFHIDYQKVT